MIVAITANNSRKYGISWLAVMSLGQGTYSSTIYSILMVISSHVNFGILVFPMLAEDYFHQYISGFNAKQNIGKCEKTIKKCQYHLVK